MLAQSKKKRTKKRNDKGAHKNCLRDVNYCEERIRDYYEAADDGWKRAVRLTYSSKALAQDVYI